MDAKFLRSILSCFIFLTLTFTSATSKSQVDSDLPEELGTALGVYKINAAENIDAGFDDFDYIYFNKIPGEDTSDPVTDTEGRVRFVGELKLKNGTVFEFRRAHFGRKANGDYQGISFRTAEMRGISYSFRGWFLELKTQEYKGGSYTALKGQLTKFIEGKQVAKSEFPFFQDAEL